MVLLAAAALAALLALALRQALGQRTVRFLRDVAPLPEPLPRVSAVVAACNEERGIAAALRSLLALDCPGLEVIVVDDRSSDGTPRILERLSREHPRLRLVRVERLPPGWLGKNHALHAGAAAASGDWLLFTDADVVHEPSALRRALALALEERLDHLTVTPELRMQGALLNMLAGAFLLLFNARYEPWKAKDPKSRAHIGVGAFNLVRAEAYRRAGGHEAIAMRPDDDMSLGKRLKESGARQDLAFGPGLVRVAWYASTRELIRGLMKNTFAGLGYSLPLALAALASMFVVFLLPFFTAVLGDGTARIFSAAAVAALGLAYADNARFAGLPAWHAVGLPVALALWLYIVARAVVLTLARGGIEWRGTFYRLEELRRNVV